MKKKQNLGEGTRTTKTLRKNFNSREDCDNGFEGAQMKGLSINGYIQDKIPVEFSKN